MQEPPPEDPLVALVSWYEEAVARGAKEPEAMTLATAAAGGRPSARVVLFKGLTARGELQFVGNYRSRKGRELEANPYVALVFFWAELMRQVRVEGRAAPAPAADSEAYFATRPRGSQLSAWASSQSEPIGSRAELEARWTAVTERFEGQPVPCPPHWGIYSVEVDAVELWESRPQRLHDRFRYERVSTGWRVARLCP